MDFRRLLVGWPKVRDWDAGDRGIESRIGLTFFSILQNYTGSTFRFFPSFSFFLLYHTNKKTFFECERLPLWVFWRCFSKKIIASNFDELRKNVFPASYLVIFCYCVTKIGVNNLPRPLGERRWDRARPHSCPSTPRLWWHNSDQHLDEKLKILQWKGMHSMKKSM